MQNSEFAYFSSKSGKHMKQLPSPPFWGDVAMKKWSQFLDSGARSPIFGHLKLPKVPIFRCPNPKTETTFSRQHSPQMVD